MTTASTDLEENLSTVEEEASGVPTVDLTLLTPTMASEQSGTTVSVPRDYQKTVVSILSQNRLCHAQSLFGKMFT